jgi:hypothetical protein
MMSNSDFTPIPLAITASLRNLTGEEFKILGVFCYQTYNRQSAEVTFEQIQSLSGVPREKIKPTLHRLLHRGWILQTGIFYQLALPSAQPEVQPAGIQYDTALGIRPPRPKAHLLYPEGPWLTENGLLNEDFVRDRAQVWRTGNSTQTKAFGDMAIEDVMGAVCKHYAQPEHHANLEIDWQSYCLKNQRYLSNVQQRLQAGTTIDEREQAVVLSKLPALMEEVQPVYEAASLPPKKLPEPQVMQLELTSVVVQPELPLTPEEVQPQIKRLAASKTLSSKGERDRLTKIDQLKLWLADPILRPEAVRRARAQGYELEYDEQGVAIGVLDGAIAS